MQSLSERYKTVAKHYKQLKQAAERQVKSWRWATWQKYELFPLYNLRNRWGSGRWLKDTPKNKTNAFGHGFDAAGRVVVVRQGVEFAGQFYETFYTHEDDRIDAVHFSYSKDKELINVQRLHLEQGRPVLGEQLAEGGYCSETYTYRGDQLTRIDIRYSRRGPVSRTVKLKYDELGRLDSMVQHYAAEDGEPASKEVLYQRPRKGESIPELSEIVQRQLVEQIPALIAKARIKPAAYCLFLGYDWENPFATLPPMIAIGTEPERADAVTQHGKEAKYYLWNPADLQHDDAVTFRDKPLLKLATCSTSSSPSKRSASPSALS